MIPSPKALRTELTPTATYRRQGAKGMVLIPLLSPYGFPAWQSANHIPHPDVVTDYEICQLCGIAQSYMTTLNIFPF